VKNRYLDAFLIGASFTAGIPAESRGVVVSDENRFVTEDFDTVDVSTYAPEKIRLEITSWDYANATLTLEQAWNLGTRLHVLAMRAGYQGKRGTGS
jgi:hypothetical protein